MHTGWQVVLAYSRIASPHNPDLKTKPQHVRDSPKQSTDGRVQRCPEGGLASGQRDPTRGSTVEPSGPELRRIVIPIVLIEPSQTGKGRG
jgi:hypothetical protein